MVTDLWQGEFKFDGGKAGQLYKNSNSLNFIPGMNGKNG
jgi:hypothetical protein